MVFLKKIFLTTYGSHLYGTNIATSDFDQKGVFLPSSEDILMGNHPATNSENTNTSGGRNTKEDVDMEMFSLKKFLHSIITGQTFALELLHSPKQFWAQEPDPVWLELVANKDKLISKNVTSMVSYARSQAFKYGEKGKRLEVFKDVVEFFNMMKTIKLNVEKYDGVREENVTVNSSIKSQMFLDIVNKHKEFISIHKKDNDISGGVYLDVNGVMVPVNASVEYALEEVYAPRLKDYGARAMQAMQDKGKDLKALYHSVRISHQIVELLTTGTITFPRPEKDLLLRIRNGDFSDKEIKDLVDESFERVIEAEKISTLRPNADKKWANEFMMQAHLNVVKPNNQGDDEDDTKIYYNLT